MGDVRGLHGLGAAAERGELMTDDELIERMAEAIWLAAVPPPPPWEVVRLEHQEEFRSYARAALAVVREAEGQCAAIVLRGSGEARCVLAKHSGDWAHITAGDMEAWMAGWLRMSDVPNDLAARNAGAALRWERVYEVKEGGTLVAHLVPITEKEVEGGTADASEEALWGRVLNWVSAESGVRALARSDIKALLDYREARHLAALKAGANEEV
jgi:hypothetical protein